MNIMKKILWINNLILYTILILSSLSCKKEEIPILITSSISSITDTSAKSGGNITSEGSSTVITRGVCWSTGITPTIVDNKTTDGAGAGSFTSNIIGLFGGTTYYVRAYATNSAGTGYGMTMSFNTTGEPPSEPMVITQNVTNIQVISATFNAIINAKYFPTTVTFEYGTSLSYGSTVTATQSPVTGNTNTNVSVNTTGLSVATTYHYRIKAVNTLGTTYSSDLTFKTLGQVPTATTLAVTNMSTVTVQLNGTVNANFLESTVTFEYGTTSSYGNTVTATQSPVSGNTNTTVSANITGLAVTTIYHYRVKAVNSLGTTYGSDRSFLYLYYGLSYQGGLVFYIDGTAQHGLVCAPIDQGLAVWGCSQKFIVGADGTSVGTGNQNTINIVNDCTTPGIAAKICYDLVLNSYSDWYLPSKDELGLMYTNLKLNGLSVFSDYYYWSSSEYNIFGDTSAWEQYFGSGSQPGSQNGNLKSNSYYVRAVRAF